MLLKIAKQVARAASHSSKCPRQKKAMQRFSSSTAMTSEDSGINRGYAGGGRREGVTVAAGHLQDIEQSVMCAAAYRSWTAKSRKKPHASVIELAKRSSSAYLDNRGALLTDQWLTSSIYSQRCYHRG